MTARTPCRALATVVTLAAALAATAPAHAELYWDFAYTGTGVSASGILITEELADASGYYLATGIQGQRNGSAITGLQPAGTAIPLNEPFEVDNLVRADGRLSSHGLGFATASGEYANLFRAGWLSPAANVEFASNPGLNSTTEEQVSWQFSLRSAALPPVPEPSTAALALAGLAGLGGVAASRRRR